MLDCLKSQSTPVWFIPLIQHRNPGGLLTVPIAEPALKRGRTSRYPCLGSLWYYPASRTSTQMKSCALEVRAIGAFLVSSAWFGLSTGVSRVRSSSFPPPFS